MVADDNAFNIIAIESLLLYYSLDIVSAHNGTDAIDYVRERFEESKDTFKLMFIDYSMPDYNGPQVA